MMSMSIEHMKEKIYTDIEEISEEEFQEVLEELKSDPTLIKFHEEYEKLFLALKKSHEGEKRLMEACRKLNAELKVMSISDSNNNDKESIEFYKEEVGKTELKLDEARQIEDDLKNTIETLKIEIADLNKQLETIAQNTSNRPSAKELEEKEELLFERNKLLEEVSELRTHIGELQDREQNLEGQHQELNDKIQELNQDILARNNEAQRELRRKEKLEIDLRLASQDLENKLAEIDDYKSKIEKYTKDKQLLEKDKFEIKSTLEKQQKDKDLLDIRLQKLQADLEEQTNLCNITSAENNNKAQLLKHKEEEISQLKSEIMKVNKTREAAQKRLKMVEDQKIDVEKQKDILKNQISGLEKELETAKKLQDIEKKALEDMTRERDLLGKSIDKAGKQTEKQIGIAKNLEQSKASLIQEINNFKEDASKQRKIIIQLEKERDRFVNEASEYSQKVLQKTEEIKVFEMEIYEYKKKIAETETKLKQQQNLYEAVRAERNLYSKNLIEIKDDFTEIRQKFKVRSHEIDQQKEEISNKDAMLAKEHLERQKVEKDRDVLKEELQKIKQQIVEARNQIDNHEKQEKSLMKSIGEIQTEKSKLKKDLDQIMNDKETLSSHLVLRNDELSVLYEKVKLLQATLSRGEQQYNQRMEDIRVLKLEVKKLQREKVIMSDHVSNIDEMSRDVFTLQRELLQERVKVKVLEEELENPLNVHRWRKLEGSDPNKYEMIQKMHALQKRLISKTEEVVEKELLIQEKEKLYMELKNIMSRQPGPEVAEQLLVYQASLKDKTKQMKAMMSEMNMHQSQCKEYEFEIERLSRELQDIRKKYFMQKKKERQAKEVEQPHPHLSRSITSISQLHSKPHSSHSPSQPPMPQKASAHSIVLTPIFTKITA